MKKILAFLCASILLVSLCAACQSKELPDTYVEGSDYQYMQLESRRFFMMQSQGSKAFYLLHGNYIYFIDEGSDMILPLCNKADCLHDKETDPEKYSYCNACILPENKLPLGDAGISYCNGFLYCLDCGYAGPNRISLPYLRGWIEKGNNLPVGWLPYKRVGDPSRCSLLCKRDL